MATIKTFVAVRAAERINNNVAKVIQRLSKCSDDYHWTETENLHVTMNFVGDVVDTEVPELCGLLKREILQMEPFDMQVTGLGGFPDQSQPRVLWTGVSDGTEQLKTIQKSVESVLSHWGVNKDRNEYVPHMTLGRLKRGGRWQDPLLEMVQRLQNHDGGLCHVDRVIVYSSYQDRGGPTYTPMATMRLEG